MAMFSIRIFQLLGLFWSSVFFFSLLKHECFKLFLNISFTRSTDLQKRSFRILSLAKRISYINKFCRVLYSLLSCCILYNIMTRWHNIPASTDACFVIVGAAAAAAFTVGACETRNMYFNIALNRDGETQ